MNTIKDPFNLLDNSKKNEDTFNILDNLDNFRNSLDRFFTLSQPVNSVAKASSNTLFGLNATASRAIVNENRDRQGFVFFTRPQLNMTAVNLRNVRQMYNLLTKDPLTVQRYIRCVLDPRQATLNNIKSPLIDTNMPFIPVLTNTIKSLSGWPDITMSNFTSKEGVRKEQYTQADGSTDIFEAYDIDATFKNTRDEPILMLFQYWLVYIGLVFEGVLMPYMDMIAENEIDYNTRIYRLVMDETNTIVKKISCTGASFPVNVPTGKVFDYNNESVYNNDSSEINIRFRCVGARYNDAIIVKDFNKVNEIFNPEVSKLIACNFKESTEHNLIKIPHNLLETLNYRGYPIINTNTYELEWWINKNSPTTRRLFKLLDNKTIIL